MHPRDTYLATLGLGPSVSELATFICATGLFILLNSFQKRYFPSSYAEPINITYGLDPVLTLPKIVTRFGLPLVIGSIIGVVPSDDSLIVAFLATFFGPFVLVYPQLVEEHLRPYFVWHRRRAATMAYIMFCLVSAQLGALGAIGASLLLKIELTNVSSPLLDVLSKATDPAALLPSVLGGVVTLVIGGLSAAFWRRIVNGAREGK